MRVFTLAAVLTVAWALAACSTAPIRLQHPETKQTVQCGPYPAVGTGAIATGQREAQCINDFKQQGYVRLPN